MPSGNFPREGYLRENYRLFHLRDTAGQERDFHFHDFDKLVILLAGRVDYTVEGITYALQPWDVLLVKHHTIHRALIDRELPYERVILYIDSGWLQRSHGAGELMTCFDTADRLGCHSFRPGTEERESLSRSLERFESALSDGEFGAAALRDARLMELLVIINRMARREGGPESPDVRSQDPKIARALDYINENLGRDISVEEIAEYAWLSKYYFMRLFKAQTGVTVHAYVRQKRLLNAARLIRAGVPVSKAAEDSGFRDYSTFYRAFRDSFGVTPGELK